MKNLVIGLSGVAGSGKDTFYSLLKQELSKSGYDVLRFSLADFLKDDVNEWTKKAYGIDALSCSREEKDLIRSFLVFHGTLRRRQTEGQYWIQKLQEKINAQNFSNNSILVITDIRYDDYEHDEVFWLQETLKGVLVHISMRTESGILPPINEEEERNNQKLINKSNYKLEWEEVDGSQEYILENLISYIKEFESWLFDGNRLPTCDQR